ncbi:hypothetical protein V2G26_006139 [Clonostachys chloroleuca]
MQVLKLSRTATFRSLVPTTLGDANSGRTNFGDCLLKLRRWYTQSYTISPRRSFDELIFFVGLSIFSQIQEIIRCQTSTDRIRGESMGAPSTASW